MMKYYRLLDDMTTLNRWHLGMVTFEDGSEPLLTSGIRQERKDLLFTAVHHVGTALEFCLTSFAVPVATVELASAVALLAKDDIQCLDLRIDGHVDMVVLNALRMVQCIDEQRSELIKWTHQDHRADLAGQYRSVPKLVVDPGMVSPDAHIFRIKAWSVALIVSETLKEVMERAGCRGATFTEVSPTG